MDSRPIERWNQLRASNSGDGILEIPSLATKVDSGYGIVRFAIGPQGEPRLLVPCGSDVKFTTDSSNGRLGITVSRLLVDKRNVLFIDVMCLARSLDSVFAELADEIVHRISQSESPLKAVEGTISDFRSLLNDVDYKEIPDHLILGLVGELAVLRELVKFSPTAVNTWTGPLDQRHDFRKGTKAIEVKTSARADATAVSISSIEQLAEPTGGTLLLVHIKAERAENGPLSVSALTSEIMGLGGSREPLMQRLAALECSDPSHPAWNRISYSLEGMDAYQVKDGFPRITSSYFDGGKLPEGIRAVSYMVDLLAAKEFFLSSSARDTAFREILA